MIKLGKKSRLRMTDRTEEERISKLMNLNNTEDALKRQKQENKYRRAWKHIQKHFHFGEAARIGA